MINFLKKHWLIILAILYFLFPIDFIPDVVLPVGFFDDATIMGLGIIREIVLTIVNAKKDKAKDQKKVVLDGEEA